MNVHNKVRTLICHFSIDFQYDLTDPGCILDRELTTFGVFQIGMTSVDVGTDGVQAYDYYKNENYWWGTSTVSIMFLPLVTCLLTEVLNNLIRYCRGDEVSWTRRTVRGW